MDLQMSLIILSSWFLLSSITKSQKHLSTTGSTRQTSTEIHSATKIPTYSVHSSTKNPVAHGPGRVSVPQSYGNISKPLCSKCFGVGVNPNIDPRCKHGCVAEAGITTGPPIHTQVLNSRLQTIGPGGFGKGRKMRQKFNKSGFRPQVHKDELSTSFNSLVKQTSLPTKGEAAKLGKMVAPYPSTAPKNKQGFLRASESSRFDYAKNHKGASRLEDTKDKNQISDAYTTYVKTFLIVSVTTICIAVITTTVILTLKRNKRKRKIHTFGTETIP